MKTNIFLLVSLLLLTLASCNNSNQNKEAEVISPADSTAFEVKVSSEDLQQQAEELDQEVDSLVNSLN